MGRGADRRGLKLRLRLGLLGKKGGCALGCVCRTALELTGNLVEDGQLLVDVLHGPRGGDRLEAPDVGARGALRDDLEEAELGGVARMRAAAQLTREALRALTDGDDAHDVAVLLAKQRDRAGRLRLLKAHLTGHDRLRGKDLGVHKSLDTGKLVGGHGLEVREIEAQPIGSHQ